MLRDTVIWISEFSFSTIINFHLQKRYKYLYEATKFNLWWLDKVFLEQGLQISYKGYIWAIQDEKKISKETIIHDR